MEKSAAIEACFPSYNKKQLRGAFSNTFDLHLAIVFHYDLGFVYFWVAV